MVFGREKVGIGRTTERGSLTINGKETDTPAAILAAARTRLLADGYARLSTRKVAQEAGVPLSQVHYHFGSKGGMVLALLENENRRRLARQTTMYAQDTPLWKRWEQACDYFEDDLESGYVRVLQEMIAAGWSTPEIGAQARTILKGWFDLLVEVARGGLAAVWQPRPVRAGGDRGARRLLLHRRRGTAARRPRTPAGAHPRVAAARRHAHPQVRRRGPQRRAAEEGG